MTKPSAQLIREWYKKAATCPHKPKCVPLRSCDKAVPMDDHLSMFELGGSGGNDPERRAVSFIQLNSTFELGDSESGHRDIGNMADRYTMESNDAFGSADLADHPTAVAWRLFSQAVQELPRRYPRRNALVALSESGFISRAARKVKINHTTMMLTLDKFCLAYGFDRKKLLLHKTPGGK